MDVDLGCLVWFKGGISWCGGFNYIGKHSGRKVKEEGVLVSRMTAQVMKAS